MVSKSTELTLKKIGDFLSKLAEKSEYVYWLSSPDFKSITYVSPAYEKIWGRSRDELYTNPEKWISFLVPEDVHNYHPIYAMAARVAELGPDARYNESYRIVRPDGQVRWILDRGFPIYNDEGECCGVTGVAVDFTKEKEIEIKLREAKEAAEAASAAKTEFIRNMSHDLRTPLMGIIGMAEIINRLPEARMTQEGARDIHQAGLALLNLLNEIIATSQLDSGEMTLKKTCFELKHTLNALTVIFKPAIKQKGLKLETFYDDNIPKVLYGQELLLHRIILNLLGNAVKFTDKGSINLELSLLQRRSDKVSIKIVVKDSGIGIPQNKQELIFEKFSRLTPSYENQYQGSGLGLYMVKQYIEKLGGDIKVTSMPDKGAQFTCTVQFKLPSASQLKKYQLTVPAQLPQLPAIKPTQKKTTPVRVGPEPKVLLVEDNELIQKTTVANLQSWGYGLIDVAKTGKEGLDRLAQKRYDLVYLDLGLPDFDGTIIAEKVCQDAHSPNQHTPFIALTAHSDQKLINECLEKGIKQVLDKPLLADAAKKIADQFLSPAAIGLRVDWALWEKRCGENKDLVKETLGIIIKELPEFKADSQAALAQKNYQELAHIIHKCCGGLKYCGFPQLEAATFALLQALRQEHYGEVESLFQGFCQELDAVLGMEELHG